MTPRRRAIAAALVLALAVPLTGCVPLLGSLFGGSVSTPTGEQVDPDLERYYHQVLSWSSCESGLQCATAIAPLDWDDPAGATIDLALVRHQATGERLGSLLINPGGPGGSGYSFVADSLDYAVGPALQASYDVVGFDPRGVGRSSAVSCGTDAQLDDYFFTILPGDPGSTENIDAQLAANADYAAGCLDGTGELLGHIDTVSAARDLDLLRAALGDTELNYLGYSYGTLLGATFADLYPDKVGRLVLDGAVDPTADAVDATIYQAAGFESAFRAYLADCLTRSDCPFEGMTVDEAVRVVAKKFQELQDSPVAAADGRELGAATFFTAIVLPLYSQDTWEYLDYLFTEVFSGGTDIAFLLADSYYDRDENGVYTTNATEAFLSINCLDAQPDDLVDGELDTAAYRADATRIIDAAPLFGPQMAWGFGCTDWPFEPTGTGDPLTAAGAAPILVLGTTNDPATPYAEAVALSEQLDSGVLVTYNGEGHTAYNKGSACIDGTVEDYLIDGTVPAADPDC